MSDKNWPAWYNGPSGETKIFNSADEVPTGWTSGAEKRKANGDKSALDLTLVPVPEPADDPKPAKVAKAKTPKKALRAPTPVAAVKEPLDL